MFGDTIITCQQFIPTVKLGFKRVILQPYAVATAAPMSYGVGHELLSISELLRGNCEVICLTAKTWSKNWSKLGHLTISQDNDPKHTSKSTLEQLKNKRNKALEQLSLSPDIKPIELLWLDLKSAVHERMPKKPHELKRRCKEEWAKTDGGRLIKSHRKLLLQVTAAKGGSTSY